MSSKPQVVLLAGEKQSRETWRAVQACNDWLRLGPGRNLLLLFEQYKKQAKTGPNPPTRSYYTLKDWSTKYVWIDRAPLYDQAQENIKNAIRRQIMQEGLALDYERVLRLDRLAEFLEEQLYERGTDEKFHNVWLPDVRIVNRGKGKTEEVGIERFNAPLIREYRKALADLAAETGGRRRIQESWDIDVSRLPMGALERLAAGDKLIDVLLDIAATAIQS